MRRSVLGLIVALLAISASGVLSLTIAEPCPTATTADHDAACPPTCVTCGCCAQAAEPASPALASGPVERVAAIVAALPRLPQSLPHDILHVPKLRFA